MPSILIADDDPDLREILTTVFTGAGMDVVAAADGATALQLAVQSAPDVVLADFDMPGLTGVQLCTAMREHGQLRSVPVAILTGYLITGDSQIRELSCCTVMFQPCSNKELIAVMHALIERGNHDHDPQGQCLSSDGITALAGRAAEPPTLMFSPPYVDLSTPWPVADGEGDDPYQAYPPALPLPAAHPYDPRLSARSRRFTAAPTRTEH